MPNIMQCMTDLGRQRYELISKYHLDEYYQVIMGNLIIPNDSLNDFTLKCILIFLKDNPEWVLGHEENYWYVNTLDDLKEL